MRQKPVARYVTLGFTFLLSIATVAVGLSMLQESEINLNSATKSRGIIATQQTGKHFSFRLDSRPTTFQIYRAGHNYDDLRAALAIGDTVTVYAINSATANLQIGQVEKNGQIIVSKQLLEGQNKSGGLIALLGGFILAAVGSWQFRGNKVLR